LREIKNNRPMKKLLLFGTMFIALAACKGTSTEIANEEPKDGTLVNLGSEKSPIYYLTLEAEDGDKTKKKIQFNIDELLVKKLKLSESKIRNICSAAIIYADWNVKFQPTYKADESASLSYDDETSNISAFMSGTAENAYGVPDNINTIIRFDKKGKMIYDKDGIPEIY
jgi:hypothetical protein